MASKEEKAAAKTRRDLNKAVAKAERTENKRLAAKDKESSASAKAILRGKRGN